MDQQHLASVRSPGRFAFRAFTIKQDEASWKVGTDSVLLGAWTQLTPSVKTILDPGAGTGVLSLLMAQRHPAAKIDAVEKDLLTIRELKHNISGSDWSDRIQAVHEDVQVFATSRRHLYDLIICNPPYFAEGQQSATGSQRTLARQGGDFHVWHLPKLCDALLAPAGTLSVVMPASAVSSWIALANAHGYYASRRLDVSHRPGLAPSLTLLQMSRALRSPHLESMALYEEGERSSAYRALCAPYLP
ncbi:MAG: methyltransferase [Saprospiraceae bacterium]|nr:methyltransferase [Saprospiraceae bacterium]